MPATQLQENFDFINQSGQRLLHLLNELLDLSRLENGCMKMQFCPCSLTDIVQNCLGELGSLLAAKQLTVELKLDQSLPYPEVDRSRMAQVVVNVLSNAIKFSPERGVISIVFRVTPCHIDLVIQDQGIGIPPAELEYVFDKFEQGSRTRNGAGGAGLGLAICREILNLHHGLICAQSDGEHGTAFLIQLPLHQPHIGVQVHGEH